MEIGTLYITSQGAKLTKVGERLVIRDKENKVLHDIPFFRVRQIICFGSVEITSQSIFQIMRRSIDVVYLTKSGRFKCRLSNLNESMVQTRTEQYRRANDNEFRLNVAKAIVRGKLLTYKNWMMFKQRRGIIEAGSEIMSISEAINLIDSALNTDELMGLEGLGSRNYFEAFKKSIKQEIGFNERNRRPPRDPVNAMLSFGYTLLLNKVLSAIEQVGVDPFMANLHANQNNRPSLALDLMEEFRHFLVDAVVLRMVNLAQVRPNDFLMSENKGMRMNERVIALLVKEIQGRLASSSYYARDNKKMQLQDQILRQAYLYRDAIKSNETQYVPLVFNK